MNVVITPQSIHVSAKPAQATVDVEPQSVEIVANPETLGIALSSQIVREIVGGEPYDGSYTVSPTNETQTLETSGKLLTRNLTINPIPSNYGLITWSGAVLTVS